MIKAAFFDIDGTLVSFKTHVISEKSLETLHRLREKGVKLFIASGRHLLLMDNLKGFSFDGYICMNGALVINNGKTIYRHPIHQEDAMAIAKVAEKENIPCAVFAENGIGINIHNELTQRVFEMIKISELRFIDIVKAAEDPVYQYTIFVNDEMEQEHLSPILKHSYTTRWNPDFTDIIPQGLSKAEGIERIIKEYGISKEEVIAFGDGGNDIEMLQYAGIGVAMGNAVEEVRKYADYVTESVDDDGIAVACERLGIL